jgi:hypothetical protein
MLSRIRAFVATTPALATLVFALGVAPAAHAQVTYKLGFDGANPPSAEYMRRVNELLPPQPEFFLAPRWPGVAGSPKVVTWSFIPDGVNIPTVLGENAGVSSLFARMDSLYAGQGGRATWVSRIQSCFDRWEELSGIDFVRIQAPGVDWDDGAAWGTLGSANRGDIRISMKRLDGPGGVTIVGAFPGNGDIVLDRLDAWETPADANRFLRNQMMWAQGIACGIDLSCPNDGTKLMEPVIPLSFDGPRQDDIRAAQRHYGDVNELDDSVATATALGAIAVGNSISLGAVPPPLVGTNDPNATTLSIDADGELDHYSFSVNAAAVASIVVTPVGSTYDLSPNGGACTSGTPFDALQVADLALELVAPDGATVLASASSTGRGAAESILLAPLNAAGTYFVRVLESGSVASSQLYSLEVSISACTLDSDGDGAVDCVDACPLDPAKVAPGLCGCGVADTDSDGDTTPDCTDLCPNDAAKTAPGACGCGVADTDSDGDTTPDCNDGCPSDATKIAPGACGCGVSDADADGDGTPNCNDGCPNDPAKLAPGACGCGVSDADADGDGTPNCNDGCPSDPFKLAPGVCGCGVADTDSDGDGTPNCNDGCPNDPLKIVPGACGCGVGDTDSDGDSVLDCFDGCPNDPLKVTPGQCGCGVPETDSDNDGVADCNDGCPNDPLKVNPGFCGCGALETDSDGDSSPDCVDGCPNDPLKLAPGQCGCGALDTDTDSDGTADCVDGCPNDPFKIAAGVCGCGVSDADTDGDGTPNCVDGCPNDPFKLAPGVCGCGVADTDSDGDGAPNCVDGCPNDPLKLAPGVCGCGVADADSDGDGALNCLDGCPNDPAKLAPGVCGCGVSDVDTDSDGAADCADGCPNDPLKLAPGVCGCGVSDADNDGDSIADCVDNCPATPNVFQEDADGDQRGDACDNCVNHSNPGQENCDGDAQGDVCEIALGLEIDCDQNGVPDNCEPDCNGNGQVDACDILLGSSLDSNTNQIPDDCEAPCPAIQTYCSAKLSSNGCLPSMGWSGTPSLSAGSGFVINCTLAIPDRSGQLFYGYAASFAPFQGGFVCVRPPLRRTVVQQSVGVGPCGGVFSFDYNVWLAGNFDTNLTAGTNVFARWWMRDPQASFTTGFSDALTFTVCP